MPINKNAVLRYLILDKCFQNYGRTYYFSDLLQVVNEALLDDNPNSTGIQIRQLRDDIRFMKSEAGYSAPIETFRDGKKGYYRYDDKNYSINNSPLNATEAEQLKNAISVLQRFEGSPEFEWIGELAPKLNDQFGLKDESRKVMGFDSNVDYEGYSNITPLFNAIVNKAVLMIDYHPFDKPSFKMEFHPYYLKQFNNRWFVFGRNALLDNNHWNLPLDRIKDLLAIDSVYVEDQTDWEDYFFDFVGVSRPLDGVTEKVELLFTQQQAPYVITKPLHPSHKITHNKDGSVLVRLNLMLNYELEMKLLSFADKVKILSPQVLLDNIKARLSSGIDQY